MEEIEAAIDYSKIIKQSFKEMRFEALGNPLRKNIDRDIEIVSSLLEGEKLSKIEYVSQERARQIFQRYKRTFLIPVAKRMLRNEKPYSLLY